MAKKKNKRTDKSFSEVIGLKNILQNDILNFILGILLLFLSIYMIIAFISYFATGHYDQSLILDHSPQEILNKHGEFKNNCGSMGAFISYFMISRCFGLAAFVIPFFMGLAGLHLTRAYKVNLLKWFICLMIAMEWFSVAAAKILTPIMGSRIFNPGGDHGLFCSQWLENVIGVYGLTAVLLLTAIVFLTYLSKETINVVRNILNPIGTLTRKVKFGIKNVPEKDTPAYEGITTLDDPEVFDDPETQTVVFDDNTANDNKPEDNTKNNVDDDKEAAGVKEEIIINKPNDETKANSNDVSGQKDLSVPIDPREPWTKYKYPTLDLLKKYENDGKPYIDMKEQTANKNRIVEVLNSFGVQIKTIMATVGPTITLYEITPAEGVRISKIRNLEDDIALSLSALGIRIIAPIPGKGTIGIEVPNASPKIVPMSSVLASKKFQESTYELPIALGKTITNEVFMVDLAKAPHMLVAGATGQGKSVGLNAIVTSLLYKKHPSELKFVIIDPKKVEFAIYAPIEKHFLAKLPDAEDAIITDVTTVVQTLNSLCVEMDTRYDLLKKAGCRNIKEYNAKFINRQLNPANGHKFMPYIVIIIDEFGDLIMTAGKEVELPICRIAQLARAVGIHAIIATQRPTTNIITGTIKANFPARVAFRVASMMDSRTILDRPGAQQLIGKGDMLYLQGNDPVRVQCAFVDTPEVEKISEYISKQQGYPTAFELPEYVDENAEPSGAADVDMNRLDPMFEEAARLIIYHQQGSTSLIQRKLSLGYNRAGRIMDQLERAGIVGPANGSKARDVLCIDENDLQMRLGQLRANN